MGSAAHRLSRASREQPEVAPIGSVGVEREPRRENRLGRVVVAFSQRDRDLFGELQVQLRPLQRAWLLDLWDDGRAALGPVGRDALRDVVESSALVVMLLSPGFLESPFITDHGLPALLARGRGTPRVRCLYARPTMAVFESFAYADRDGLVRAIRLTDFPGLNSPARPLAALSPSERARVMVRAGREIVEASRPDHAPSSLQVYVSERS